MGRRDGRGRVTAGSVVIAIVTLGLLFWAAPLAQADESLLIRSTEKRTDDLAKMLDRRIIRALVTYDRTKFFFVKGAARGFEFELLEQYREFVNTDVSKDELAIQIVYIPVPFGRLLDALRNGEGDIAAAGLTITQEREHIVDFTDPYLPDVAEVIVTAGHVDGLEGLEDLSGREVYVRPESSHAQHLRRLNEALQASGLDPVEIVEADDKLAAEDVLEMVNAGVVDLAVADDFVAKIWSGVLTEMVVRDDLVLNAGGRIAWAVRKENPELLASLNAFLAQHKKGTLTGNILFKRYFENDEFIKNPLADDERKKFEELKSVLIQYSDRYGLDWLAVGAQAYQESGLDHSVVSPRGAIGLMQVLPSTAADPSVDIADIERLENNVHAGVKYDSFLRDRYFTDPTMDPEDRIAFTFAAYNAGPARIQKLRQRAEELGLDPNKWFGNVEVVALKEIGQETVRYVSNIHKYYVAYRLAVDAAPVSAETPSN